MDKKIFIIALLKCKGIGNAKVLQFLKDNNFDYLQSKMNVKDILKDIPYDDFQDNLDKAKCEIKKNIDNGIKLITIFDEEYPNKLYETTDPILYLYYIGDIKLINLKNILIVGTRKPSDEGKAKAIRAGEIFGSKGYVVTSGLALGCDMNAHMGCLKVNGKTIAVLPSDLIKIQPSSNRELAQQIVDKGGCLITEYPVGMITQKFNFAKRDRIQSALADVILVIEADEKSGTMIAVKKALKENKKVYILEHNAISFLTNKIDLDNEVDIAKIEKELKSEVKDKRVEKQYSLFEI